MNNFWNRIFEYSELKCLISVTSTITDSVKFKSLVNIIESDFTKLKYFVKYYQDEISNFRYVKFFKIAAGSAHVCLRTKLSLVIFVPVLVRIASKQGNHIFV